MGFSLESLFFQLNETINNDAHNDTTKIEILTNKIKWWQDYAVQCGKLTIEDKQ